MRISKKSGAIIPKPDRSHLTYLNRTKQREPGVYDTRGDLVLDKTYTGEDFLKVKAEFEEYIRMKEDKERLLVFKHWYFWSDPPTSESVHFKKQFGTLFWVSGLSKQEKVKRAKGCVWKIGWFKSSEGPRF